MAGSSTSSHSSTRTGRLATALIVFLTAVGLSMIFWRPLWTGGGLVGSDIYAYFLPQKAFFAEQLQAGRLPIWNDRLGWGYPQLAESQTGVFYPLHWPLYLALDLNTAYSASQLLHYVLAFAFTWLYARRIGLATWGATLAALVYTYGWFPSRICLEWAIIGGAWFPAALWCVESGVQTRHWRYGLWLTVILGLQMLAGHFTLAFVTQLTVCLYLPLRLWFAGADLGAHNGAIRRSLAAGMTLAVAGGFLLSAVQLLPTWKLKQQSQRKSVSSEHDPGYGYLPAPYLAQIVAPWYWYADEANFTATVRPDGSRTNRVEAHLYFGLIPVALAVWGGWTRRKSPDRRFVLWLALGAGAVVYATGILIPLTRHLPGFSFFEGPGRFGIVTTYAAGLWAGMGMDQLLVRVRASRRVLIGSLLAALTIADLWIVSREVTFAYLVDRPPLAELKSSPLRQFFAKADNPVRLFSPGKNLPSLLGVSTLPIYLGLGPAPYFDREGQFPGEFNDQAPPTEEQIDWLRHAGVTHLLSFMPLDTRRWPVDIVWQGADPFLNRSLARGSGELLFLYALQGSRGGIAWEDATTEPLPQLRIRSPMRIEIETAAKRNDRLILTELSYPGWHVTIDGREAQLQAAEGIFRTVPVTAGLHTIVWNYHPVPLYWGGGISIFAMFTLLTIGHIRYWHPNWLVRSSNSAPRG